MKVKEKNKQLNESQVIHSKYISMIRKFEKTCDIASKLSKKNAGKYTCQTLYWGALLFTRSIILSKSILTLCPKSVYNPHGDLWNFASIASITRGLLECEIQFVYLFAEDISEEEWKLRLKMIQLYDNESRNQMLKNFDKNGHNEEDFKTIKAELIGKIQTNIFYQSLSPQLQKECITGKTLFGYQTRETVLRKLCISDENLAKFYGLYKFLSSSVHSSPLSYYRMGEQNRTGIENDTDKAYITHFALHTSHGTLQGMSETFQIAFENAVLNDNILCKKWLIT